MRRLTSLGSIGLLLAAIGCGSSGGGGTGGTGGTAATGSGGSTGKAGSSGAAGMGAAGMGAGGTTGSGATGGGAGSTGNAGSTGSAGSGGTAGQGGAPGFLPTLLVDNDYSDNNDPTNATPVASASDTLFATLLSGESITYSTFVVPGDGSAPPYAQLANVSTIIWYTGDAFGADPTITSTQETTLGNWLDQGNKTLIIFSPNMISDLEPNSWTDFTTNTFAGTYLGLQGGAPDLNNAAGAPFDGNNFTATGSGSVTAFNGLSFQINGDTPNGFSTFVDAVNPAATGTDTLITVLGDPTSSGTADTATPVATGHTKGTSKIIYVGIPIESIANAGMSTSTQLFHAVLKYTGLKTN